MKKRRRELLKKYQTMLNEYEPNDDTSVLKQIQVLEKELQINETKFPSDKTFEKDPCIKCGSIRYCRVEGSPDEESGYECANCGRSFIPDKIQQKIPFDKLPYSLQELYSDRD